MKPGGFLGGAAWLALLGSIWLAQVDSRAADVPSAAKASDAPFLVNPYLQLGDAAPGKPSEDLALLWHADDVDARWSIEYQSGPAAPWQLGVAPTMRRVAVLGIAPHRVFRAALKGLSPGSSCGYRVRKDGEIVFASEARAPRSAGQPYRFVAFGDCGAGTVPQKLIAVQTHLARPDFIVITGDIVYSRGRVSEYREKFWPVYNADFASPLAGAPLLRSVLSLAAPGNHDIATRDLEKYPDGLAYFLYWDQPRNGPESAAGGPLVPHLAGPVANRTAFTVSAGDAYPRMANFSLDYGNSHWTILDSNPYVDWTNPALRGWVERDLAGAANHTWRFVAFHHPGFNSSRSHFNDQQMRLLSEVFEAGRVDVVFSGHVHNYQRSFPLQFMPDKSADGKPGRDVNKVPGRWKIDKVFDGQTRTRPHGVIYLVTGAGGANLYNPEQQDDRASWQAFTDKFVSKVHSLTVADVDRNTLTIRQVAADGAELDRFTITK